MGLRVEHPLHERRRSRNVGLGLVLLAFVALVFGLSVVKIRQGDLMEAFDHQPRTSALPIAPVAPEPGPAPAESAPTSDTAAPLTEKTLP